ncbi:MAG: multicopper oxidase family protein [Planctomycetes bacterium]|nr:multicopper oxidase family protein [Planctomycetota bacterium]
MTPTPLSPDRRQILQGSLSLAAAGTLARLSAAAQSTPIGSPPALSPSAVAVRISLVAAPSSASILPGVSTQVWRYTGQVRSFHSGALQPIPGSHLGPVLRFQQGDRAQITVTNLIGEDHVVHWHGLDVPSDMDGHPRHQFPHGSSTTYDFPVLNRAGTYWYHSHADMRTGFQAYKGLAGPLVVSDAQEQALALPRGQFDVPLVLQDASFDTAGQLAYSPLNMQNGFLGTTQLVNGKANATLNVATRAYRLRIVNGATSRVYKLAWSDGTPMVVIGNDGGLLAAPSLRPYVTLSPGERAEVWADFRQHAVGSQVVLRSLPFSGVSMGQGAQLDLLTVQVTQSQPETLQLPATLSTIQAYVPQQATNYGNPRSFAISFSPGIGFTLNGGTFQMTGVAANEIVRRDTLEHVRITNTTGMMVVGHPIHFHGRQFQVLGRSVASANLAGWQTLSQGFIDEGWKDTVLVMPGETIDLLVRYSSYTGLFLYHCHNLVHEDMGMMRNLRIDP